MYNCFLFCKIKIVEVAGWTRERDLDLISLHRRGRLSGQQGVGGHGEFIPQII